MAYATVADIEARIGRELDATESAQAATLLDDAAVIIDTFAPSATADVKCVVSCRMVIRSLGVADSDMPIGATQGSISGLGYSQSWTLSGGANGELYLSKLEKSMLGMGNNIGSYSPVMELVKVCAEQQ